MINTTTGHINRRNPLRVVYIKGDELTDGSIRILPDLTGENAEFQLRTGGIWNDTGLQIAASSIALGRDLKLSGAGEFLQTASVNQASEALIPHTNFTDSGTNFPITPVLGQLIERVVAQPDDSDERVGTTLSTSILSPFNGLLPKAYARTGSVGATEPVCLTIRNGGPTGPIYWQRNLEAALLGTPNTEFEIDFEGFLQANIGILVHLEMVSDATFSLKTNPAGVWWQALDFQVIAEEDLISDNLVLANDAGLVFQNDGGFIANDVFP